MSGCHSESEQRAMGVFNLPSNADEFVELLENYQSKRTSTARGAVENCLLNFFPCAAVGAMVDLLEAADENTVQHFVQKHLSSKSVAERASVSVNIVPNPNPSACWGNNGNFFIVTQKEGLETKKLHFTNQASAVYYLMYLIHRYKESEGMTPVSLSKNRETFKQLYQQVYDVSNATVEKRLNDLLRREVNNTTRAGRLNAIRYDIRLHFEDVFTSYDESFRPYIMTAREHLAVPHHLIHFEGDAQRLLNFNVIL